MKSLGLYLLVPVLLISGCSTVPATVSFPAAPTLILDKCPQLKTIEGETVSIIDFTKTVTLNYTSYYECAAKNDAWIEWYNEQKKIFESIK
jgi:hypothetical protein